MRAPPAALPVALALLLAGAAAAAPAPAPAAPAGAAAPSGSWRLVWEDDFDAGAVNASNWEVLEGVAEGSNQIELYRAVNVFTAALADGRHALVLRTALDNVTLDGVHYNVSSGRVDSSFRRNVTFGRVEVVARLQNDAASGVHTAHWLLGYDCWPVAAEIDIMECQSPHNAYAGAAADAGDFQVVSSNLHTGATCGNETRHTTGTSLFPRTASPAVNFSAYWSTFAVEWNATDIVYFVNQTVVNHVFEDMPGWAGPVRIPQNAMYLILSQAYMAHRPYGDPPAWAWPVQQYIDAVRVFEWDPAGDAEAPPPPQR